MEMLKSHIIFNSITSCSNLFLLKSESAIWAFGNLNGTQLPFNFDNQSKMASPILEWRDKLREIKVTQNRVMLLTEKQRLYGWGDNSFFQITHDSINYCKNPTEFVINLENQQQQQLQQQQVTIGSNVNGGVDDKPIHNISKRYVSIDSKMDRKSLSNNDSGKI